MGLYKASDIMNSWLGLGVVCLEMSHVFHVDCPCNCFMVFLFQGYFSIPNKISPFMRLEKKLDYEAHPLINIHLKIKVRDDFI